MDESKINRINELAKKSKSQGLTPSEKKEQQELRKEYIKSFRNNMQSTLDRVVIVDKRGNQSKLHKKNKNN